MSNILPFKRKDSTDQHPAWLLPSQLNPKDITDETIVRIDVKNVSVPLFASALVPEGENEVFYRLDSTTNTWVREEYGWTVTSLYTASELFWSEQGERGLRKLMRIHNRKVGDMYGSEAILKVSYSETMRAVEYFRLYHPQTEEEIESLVLKIREDHKTAMAFVHGGKLLAI